MISITFADLTWYRESSAEMVASQSTNSVSSGTTLPAANYPMALNLHTSPVMNRMGPEQPNPKERVVEKNAASFSLITEKVKKIAPTMQGPRAVINAQTNHVTYRVCMSVMS